MRRKISKESLAFGSRSDHDPNRVTAFPSHGRVTPTSQSKSKSGPGRVMDFASHRRITAGSSTILYDRLLAVPSGLSCLSFLFMFPAISISTGRWFFGTFNQNPRSHSRTNLPHHVIHRPSAFAQSEKRSSRLYLDHRLYPCLRIHHTARRCILYHT